MVTFGVNKEYVFLLHQSKQRNTVNENQFELLVVDFSKTSEQIELLQQNFESKYDDSKAFISRTLYKKTEIDEQMEFSNFRSIWNGGLELQNQPDYRELHIIRDFIDLSLKQEFRLFLKMNFSQKKNGTDIISEHF